MAEAGYKKFIARIDAMTGEQFEYFVCWLFQARNYKVRRVGTTLYRSKQRSVINRFYQTLRDFGADIIAEKEGERIAVQAKRCKRPVGKKDVKQVFFALKHYGCHKAVVVSNNRYTQSAKRYASRKRIGLWDRDLLVDVVKENIANLPQQLYINT